MAAGRSFAEFVKNKCFDGLYEAAEEYASANQDSLDLRTWHVSRIGEVEFVDANIQRVYVRDLPGMRVAFDVGLELDLCVHDANHRSDEIDECHPWLRICCEGDLSQGLDDWSINHIEPYNPRGTPPLNSMSDALVPDIPKDRLETVATEFLMEYYPEALRTTPHGQPPISIDTAVLAQRLGLTILNKRIREDASVFGQLYFVDTEAELFDAKAGQTVPVHIDAQTIVVDPMNFLLRNLGSVNNTIIHECVHWVKHRKVFELEKLYNADASCISCEVVGGAAAQVAKQATEQMERQANQLTPRIQMPAGPFKAKAQEYITRFMRETDAKHENEVMEKVIMALETDFCVSKQAAKIRLVELGIDEATMALNDFIKDVEDQLSALFKVPEAYDLSPFSVRELRNSLIFEMIKTAYDRLEPKGSLRSHRGTDEDYARMQDSRMPRTQPCSTAKSGKVSRWSKEDPSGSTPMRMPWLKPQIKPATEISTRRNSSASPRCRSSWAKRSLKRSSYLSL